MKKGVTIAKCPSCSLKIRVIYENNYIDKNFSQYF